MNWNSFRKVGHPPTLFAAFLYFDVSFMVWVLLGSLAVFISQEYHLCAAQKGFLTALPLLGGALTRIPVGFLADRWGSKRMGLSTMIVACVPLLWGWLAVDSYGQLLALGFLLGVAGSSFAVALPLVSRWYPKDYQGLAMGIAGAGNSGTVLAAILAPRLAQWAGWHTVFGLALGVLLLTALLFALLAKEPPRAGAQAPYRQALHEMGEVARQMDCLWLCLIYGVTFGGFVGFASFLGIFFFDQYGLAKVEAANVMALCVFMGSFFRPVGGYMADRFGGTGTLVTLLAVIGLCLFLLGFLPPLGLALGLFLTLMAAFGMGNGSVFQLVPQRFGRDLGVVTGIVGAVGGLGGFFLPALLGFIKGRVGSFGPAFWILSLFVGLAFMALLQVQRGILDRNPVKMAPVVEPC